MSVTYHFSSRTALEDQSLGSGRVIYPPSVLLLLWPIATCVKLIPRCTHERHCLRFRLSRVQSIIQGNARGNITESIFHLTPTFQVLGKCEATSLTGTLPLVGDLKDAGFDIQVCGYGVAKVYHGVNEVLPALPIFGS